MVVEVRVDQKKGRCLHSKQRFLKEQSILSHERPLTCVMFSPPLASFSDFELDLVQQTPDIKVVGLVLLSFRVIQRILSSIPFAEDISCLCAPKVSTQTQLRRFEAITILTTSLLHKSGLNISDTKCLDIIVRIASNCFTIVGVNEDPIGIAIYKFGSTINHSCSPNCISRFDESGSLSIIAINREIDVGEEITISYSDSTKGTWARRLALLDRYFFFCGCSRCSQWDNRDGFRCTQSTCPSITSCCDCACVYLTHLPVRSTDRDPDDDGGEDVLRSALSSPHPHIQEIISFLLDTCIPCGDVLLQSVISDSLPPPAEGLLLPSCQDQSLPWQLKCASCSNSQDPTQFISTINTLYSSWRQLQQISLSPTSPLVLRLKHHLTVIALLENFRDTLQTLAPSTHYCIAQVADKLITNLMEAVQSYEELLKMSPNNHKLKRGLQVCVEKYIATAELLSLALRQILPDESLS
jgi:hypothetical protein